MFNMSKIRWCVSRPTASRREPALSYLNRRPLICAVALLAGTFLPVTAVSALAAPTTSSTAGIDSCPPGPQNTAAYVQNVEQALAANTDTWGNQAKAAPDGPSLANVSGHLHPLRDVGSGLTDSGFYYLPFGTPGGTLDGARALHVADGSQVISNSVTGRKMTVMVGAEGTERYGLCQANLTNPTLLNGYQPVLETSYKDLDGSKYSQESFAAYLPGTKQLASFVKLTATGSTNTEISLSLSDSDLSASGGVVTNPSGDVLYYSGQPTLSGSTLTYNLDLTDNQSHTVYLVRPVDPASHIDFVSDADSYTAALNSLTSAWNRKLDQGATFQVPERAVMNAEKNLLIQNLALQWRYSAGNAYEDWYPSESGDALGDLGSYGFTASDRAGLQYILDQDIRTGYPNWDRGARLQLSAAYYDLTKDASFIDQNTPLYKSFLDAMQAGQAADPNGLMPPEHDGGDIPFTMYGTASESIPWRGITDILRVWRQTGHTDLANQYQPMLDSFTAHLKAAIKSSSVQVTPNQLFIPWALLRGDQPYQKATETKYSSYWNIDNPYVLAQGILTREQLRQAWNFSTNHGSTLIGLQRFNYYPTPIGSVTQGGYPGYETDGDDTVYGVPRVKAMADLDNPDELAVTLYGKLSAGMTPNTFISGEGSTLDPSDGNYYRTMYLPPNLGNNDMFLITLHEMLVHVVDAPQSQVPTGLQLAFATPRGWLENGKKITVAGAPTPFGKVSYHIASALSAHKVMVHVALPNNQTLKAAQLRLRLPGGNTIRSATLPKGKQLAISGDTIDLTGLKGQVQIEVAVEPPADTR